MMINGWQYKVLKSGCRLMACTCQSEWNCKEDTLQHVTCMSYGTSSMCLHKLPACL